MTKEEALQRELEQAKAGTHPRMTGEEKRLSVVTANRIKRAEQMCQFALDGVNAHFEQEKAAAEEIFNAEKSTVQDRLMEDVVTRQKRHTKVRVRGRAARTSVGPTRRPPPPLPFARLRCLAALTAGGHAVPVCLR